MNSKKTYIAILIANATVYALNAFYYNFIPIFLEYKGRNDSEIGYLLAAAQLVAAFAPFFWGYVTDKSKYKNNVLIFLVICSIACFTAANFGNTLLYFFIVLPLILFFQNNSAGLIDTITIEASANNNWKYGTIRVMGALGFGGLTMVLAPFVDGENIRIIFWAYPVVGIVATICLLLSPKVEGHAEKKEKINLKELFSDRTMMMIFVILAVALLTFNYYQNFYAKYIIAPVENGGLGIAEWVMGVNGFLTIFGELIFFFLYDKIMQRVGVKKVLYLCIIAGVVRYVALALVKTPLSILAVALFTGLTPTVVTYCATYYMMRTVAPKMRASGQMAMYALCSALPRIIGCAVGGEITHSIGTSGGLLVCAVLNLLTFIPVMFIPDKLYKD